MTDRPTIGSSDAAAVLGLHPYRTPWDVWMRLTGLAPRYDGHRSDAAARGVMLEPALLLRYAQEVGVPVLPGPGLDMRGVTCAEPWMHARPDGYATPGPDQGAWWLVEAKTARYLDPPEWGPDGTDQVPQHYLVQCAWQMAVCDVDRVDMVAFGVASDDFRIYRLARDLVVEKVIVNRARAWYQRHIEQGDPPPIDASDGCREALTRQHNRAEGSIEATADTLELVDQLRQVRDEIDALDDLRRSVEHRLMAAIGDHHRLTHDGETLATLSTPTQRARVNWARLRRDHPGLIESYETGPGKPSRSLRLRRE